MVNNITGGQTPVEENEVKWIIRHLNEFFIPAFKTPNGYVKKGASIMLYVKPYTDKYWKIWKYEEIDVPEKWESWGYKCIFCDFYLPLFTPDFAKNLDNDERRAVAKAFGEVSGMNEARRIRIKIHSSAHNFMIIPALQTAFSDVTAKMSITDKKKEIVKQLIDHAKNHIEEVNKIITERTINHLKMFFSEFPIKTNGYNESDDAYIIPAKTRFDSCNKTFIVKKSAVEKFEKTHEYYEFKFYLKQHFNVHPSKSGKSFIFY